MLGNISLKYAPTDWFDIELRGGTDYYTTTKSEKVYAGGNTSPRGLYTEGSETFYENNFSFLATARKDNLIDRLGGFVTFGGNLMLQQRNKMNASAGELLVPNLFSLNNGVNKPDGHFRVDPPSYEFLVRVVAVELGWLSVLGCYGT